MFMISRLITKITKILYHKNLELYGRFVVAESLKEQSAQLMQSSLFHTKL